MKKIALLKYHGVETDKVSRSFRKMDEQIRIVFSFSILNSALGIIQTLNSAVRILFYVDVLKV